MVFPPGTHRQPPLVDSAVRHLLHCRITNHMRVFRNPGGKGGSPGDADGVEIKATEMKVDGVAESLAVAEAAR